MTAAILLSHHNVSFFLKTMQKVRESIKAGCYQAFRRDFLAKLRENDKGIV
jgi:tRNA-guanine family transglycosylase